MSSLRNKTVVVTRPRHQIKTLVSALEGAGARALLLPVIDVRQPRDPSLLADAVRRAVAGDFDVFVFTSSNAAEAFASCVARLGPIQGAAGRFVAVGPATAARLKELRLGDALVPANFTGVDAAEALGPGAGRLLLLQGDKATSRTRAAFEANGWDVTAVSAYRIVTADPDTKALDEVRAGRFDAITFTSGSSVRAFVDLIGDPIEIGLGPRGSKKVVCMGDSAVRAAHSAGLTVTATSSENTIEALVDAVQVVLADQ